MLNLRVKLIGAVAVAIVLGFCATRFPILPALSQFCDQIAGFGFLGVLCFALLLALGSLCFLPASPFIIAASAAFGFTWGVVAGVTGIALGASCGFLLSRWFLRKDVSAHLRKNPAFQSIDVAIAREGWKIIILLRLCPIPFGLANYLYGLTGISFRPYFFTTVLACLPSTLLFCHLGSAGKAGLQALASGRTDHDPGQVILLAVSVLATLAVLAFLPRFAKRAIAKHAKVSLPS